MECKWCPPAEDDAGRCELIDTLWNVNYDLNLYNYNMHEN